MSQKNNSRSGINIKHSTIKLAILGLLTALATVLAMFTIRPNPSIKISLTFIPVVIAAYIFGPVGSGLVAGLADIIGCIVKPAGMIFPPITATEIIVGMIFGLFLYQKRSFVRIAVSAGITQLVFSMFVTPIWLYLLYGFNYFVTLGARIPQITIMLAIELISIPFILKSLDKINVQKYLHINKSINKSNSPDKTESPDNAKSPETASAHTKKRKVKKHNGKKRNGKKRNGKKRNGKKRNGKKHKIKRHR